MLKGKGNIVFLVVYLLVFLTLVGYLLFNDYGVFKYFSLKGEIATLQKDLDDTASKINKLQTEVDSLEISLKMIEEVARERHHMLKTNEQGYKIQRQ